MMTAIKKVFSTMPQYSALLLDRAWLDTLVTSEKSARTKAQRLLDWYQKDRDAIIAHLKDAADKTFDPEELGEWQWAKINGVRRIVKRLAMAYKNAPKRTLVDANGKALSETDPAYETYRLMFQGMDMNKKFREFDRMAVLFNTIHVEVVPRNRAIDWDLKLRPISYAVPDPDNQFEPYRFAYKYDMMNPETMVVRTGTIVWTREQHLWVGDGGGVELGLSLSNGANPYGGKMPIVVIRKEEQDDYWGEAIGTDIVDAFEQASLQVANMWETMFFQTHSQPLGVNLGLPPGSKLQTGPRKPILTENVGRDKESPRLEFLKPETDIDRVMTVIDWFVKSTGSAEGMPPGAWSGEQKDLSGFAKLIDNIELLENREEEQPMWVGKEQELFEKSKMVWNRWPGARPEEAKDMPEDVHLAVTFEPVSFPEQPLDEMAHLKLEIELNLNSAAHYLARRDGISLDEAMKRVKEFAKANKELDDIKAPKLPAFFQGPGNAKAGGAGEGPEGEGAEEVLAE